jgi:hypothetical protein
LALALMLLDLCSHFTSNALPRKQASCVANTQSESTTRGTNDNT